jgi:hypothetical protein
MAAPDRPLTLGEVFAETIRIYQERLAAALGLGGVVSAGFLLAFLTGHLAPLLLLAAATFTAAYAAAARIVAGDSFREAWAQLSVRAPTLAVLSLVVGVPFALGRVDPLLLLFAVLWQAFIGFSVPAAAVERGPSPHVPSGLGFVLLRSVTLARAEYLHSLGVVCALVIVYLVFGAVLGRALIGLADNTGLAATIVVNVVLAPFFFLGLAVLFYEQRARASGRAS